MFVALTPRLWHNDLGELCDFSTWLSRGWCRTFCCCTGADELPHVLVSCSALCSAQDRDVVQNLIIQVRCAPGWGLER